MVPSKLHVFEVTLGNGMSPIEYSGYVDGNNFGINGLYSGGFDVSFVNSYSGQV